MTARQELEGLFKLPIVKLAALTLLLAAIGGFSMDLKYSVLDLDAWWHLSVGQWILQNHAVPHTGILSRTASTRPWVAYSWGYEVLLATAYSTLGILGVGLFGTLLTICVAAANFWGLLRVSGRFWLSWVLTIIGGYAFLFTILPRPVFVSMALFSVLLTILLRIEATGEQKAFRFLPILFLFWANLHIQFIYGLYAFGLFIAAHLLRDKFPSRVAAKLAKPGPKLSKHLLLGVFFGSLVATCIGPYSFHLYQVVFGYAKAKSTYSLIIELLPLSFLRTQHFVELFLCAAAFVAIGWQRRIDPFKVVLLATAAVLGFRTTRDAWFLCLVATFVIAGILSKDEQRGDQGFKLPRIAGMFVVIPFLLFLLAKNTDFNARGLDVAISNYFPVDASNFIRSRNLPGPIYNSFDWGGFLTWYMPDLPVSVDGRNDLYGDSFVAREVRVEAAEDPYEQEKNFKDARIILLKNEVPLASLLALDPNYQLVFRDGVASVFIPKNTESEKRGW